jgi:hypothetical protein
MNKIICPTKEQLQAAARKRQQPEKEPSAEPLRPQ